METISEKQGRILLVNSKSTILHTSRYCLGDEDCSVVTANNAPQAKALLQRQTFDLCSLDLHPNEGNGLNALAQIRVQVPWIRAVIITAHSAVDIVVGAMQAGAVDYLAKPCNPDQLRLAAAGQLEVRQLVARLEALEDEVRRQDDGPELHSPAMAAILEATRQVAAIDVNVLALGESGSGKGESARAIRTRSRRAKKSQVTINCPSLTVGLTENELFGHSYGAFTNATENTLDRISRADDGTLFLDETGDFPLTSQPKLLRLIRDKEYEYIGGPVICRADVCVLAATDRDLGAMVAQGQFHEDLLHRLDVIVLDLSPLHERTEDILNLTERFLVRFVRNYGRSARGFSEATREAMRQYSWPDNIREPHNTVERASVICSQERTDIGHLSFSTA